MNDVQLGELSDSDKSETLNSAHEFDSDDEAWSEFNIEIDMYNPKLEIELLFSCKDGLKETVKQYDKVTDHYVKFSKNYSKRLNAICKSHCSWYICASRKFSNWNVILIIV